MGGSMEEKKKESTVRGGVRGWVEAERLRVNLVVEWWTVIFIGKMPMIKGASYFRIPFSSIFTP
jgi:hypothetical protein